MKGRRRPHDEGSLGPWLQRVVHEPAPDLRQFRPELPAALAEAVAQLLARDPALRPADARTVAQRLTELAPPDPVAPD